MVTLLQQIRIELLEEVGVSSPERVKPTTKFVDDLGLDSLDLVAFFEAIEWEFSQGRKRPLKIEEDEGYLYTVRDLMDWLSCHSSLLWHPQLVLGRVRWYLKRRRHTHHA